MPDIATNFRVEGADQITRALREMETDARRFGAIVQTTFQPARQAVQAFSSALGSLSTIIRLTGTANADLARQIEMASVAVLSITLAVQGLRGATAGYTAALVVLRTTMVTVTAAAAAMWAALLGPFGAVLVAAVAVGVALGLIGEKSGFAARETQQLKSEMDDSASRSASWVRAWDSQSRAFQLERESAHSLRLELRGLLGVQDELAAQWRVGMAKIADQRAEAAAREAKAQAELAKRLQEVRLERESTEMVRNIEAERTMATADAMRRQAEFVRVSDQLAQERRRLEEETADLIRIANQQAIERIEEEERQRLEETRRVLQEIARLEQQTADLIQTANQQAIERIEEEERERIRLARERLEEEKRLRDQARQSLENYARSIGESFREAFADIIIRARSFADALSNLLENLASRLISRLFDVHILPFFLRIFGLESGGITSGPLRFAAAQHGMIFDRPTLTLMGEGGERELALPERFWPALGRGGREAPRPREAIIHLTIHNVIGDPRAIGIPTAGDAVNAVVNDITRRGPTMVAVRAALP